MNKKVKVIANLEAFMVLELWIEAGEEIKKYESKYR